MRTTLRARWIAIVALLALVIGMPSAALAADPPTKATTDAQASSWAAHFIATTLAARENHYNFPGGTFPDVGNTIDAVLALDAAKVGATQAGETLTWIKSQASAYAGWDGVTFGGGALGKLATLAVATGSDPKAFGGLDLVAKLQALETETGRFGTVANDYDVTLNQAWAILGLVRTGTQVSPAAASYLAAQQCADGGVRATLGKEPCVTDPDATAFAAQAFLAAGDTTRAGKALDKLAALQLADGSFANATGEGPNANTTAVAAQAFTAGGRTADAAEATAFLRSLQWGCDIREDLRGGIAFTAGAAAVTDANIDSALRATPQAALALAGGSLVDVSANGQAATTTPVDCTVPVEPASRVTSATQAAQWIVAQEKQGDGSYSFSSFGMVDTGLSIDGLLAVIAADKANPAIPAMWATIATNAKAYVAPEYDGVTYIDGMYAAKVMYAAIVMGKDVHDVGGVDVAKTLADKTNAAGEVLNSSNSPENIFGQSLALLATSRAGSATPVMVANIQGEQCPSGAFRMYDNAKPCNDATDGIGTDGTAMALQALLAARTAGLAVDDDAIARAVEWLMAKQDASGGWANDSFTPDVNGNSTGLAVQALSAHAAATGGAATVQRAASTPAGAITAGQAWIAGVQAQSPADDGTPLATDLGAIAYSVTAFDAGLANGLGTARSQWQRTTPQAILALAPIGFDVLAFAAPAVDPTDTGTDPTTPTTPVVDAGAAVGSSGTGSSAARSADPGALAFTGGTFFTPALASLFVLLVGAALVVVARRATRYHGAHR